MTWPPDYRAEYEKRQLRLLQMRERPVLFDGAIEYYKTRPADFIEDFCTTYDPRNAGSALPTKMPFILFDRQREFIGFLHELVKAQTNGAVNKSRDMGATWLCCAFSAWLWRFWDGAAVGWGSRKEQLVDKLGDPDSIFEKIRITIHLWPREFHPKGFSPRDHMTYMRIVNPQNGATITGEAGDNIGRGGRKLVYFKDEAQPLTAKILTPRGWSTMGDMVVGSRVFGSSGKECRVTQVNDCGEHDVYRVTFSDGTSTECSPNHLWTIQKAIGKKEERTLRTSQIADSVTYRSPGGQVQYNYRVRTCAPVEFPAKGPYPLHPYLVGALLGDGTLGAVPKDSPKITSVDEEVIQSFRDLLPEGCNVTQDGVRPTWRLGDVQGRRGWKWPSRSKTAVVSAGIAGKGAAQKYIPRKYLFGSPADRLALLQGLMDTDGSAANGGSASFHTASVRLAEDVRFLAESLGGTATVNKKPDARGFLDQYVLHLALPEGTIPFRLPRKIAQLKQRTHPMGRTILSIVKLGRAPVRCISVDADDGLYLTDHLIVTHNSAFYERPERIEASLGDNTRVQVDISTHHGPATIFATKLESAIEWEPGAPIVKGKVNAFVFDWSDHPAKTDEWYNERKQSAIDNGLEHVFAQEVDRDPRASVDGVIIPGAWVDAAVDAHLKLGFTDEGQAWWAAMDVADGGRDKNACGARKGVILRDLDEWGSRDVGEAARRAITMCSELGMIEVHYDCIGVGAGVKSEVNRLVDLKAMPPGMRFMAWDAGSNPINPRGRVEEGDANTPFNEDFYANLKAQGWWQLRRRFQRTFRAITEGIKYEPDQLISLPSTLRLLSKLKKELSQPVVAKPTGREKGHLKLLVDKTPDGMKSPNLGDTVMMCYWPARSDNTGFLDFMAKEAEASEARKKSEVDIPTSGKPATSAWGR